MQTSPDQPLLPYIGGLALLIAVVGGFEFSEAFPQQRLASQLLHSGAPATAMEVRVLIADGEKHPRLRRVNVTFEELNGRVVRTDLIGAIAEHGDTRPGWHEPAGTSRYAAPELSLRFDRDEPTRVMATADARDRADATTRSFISGGMVVAGLGTIGYVLLARRAGRRRNNPGPRSSS
ncbi:hypothetical protein [Kribbella deserti]|uniref:DUF3592 domain-containing protein n=1 Tax=Kribbella deserti TaxID=1926257 RepID=A0ABV6QT42_9ACTN